MPTLYVKLYTYQMARSLAYIHQMGICHRDIKPQARFSKVLNTVQCCEGLEGLEGLEGQEGQLWQTVTCLANVLGLRPGQSCVRRP